MMSFISIVFLASSMALAHGMTCEWPGSRDPNNFIDNTARNLINHCPGIIDSSDKQYCCTDPKGNFHCCDFTEFALTYIIIAVAIVAILSVLCSIICCCCCPCCFIYKRRHGNIV